MSDPKPGMKFENDAGDSFEIVKVEDNSIHFLKTFHYQKKRSTWKKCLEWFERRGFQEKEQQTELDL